MPRQRPILWQRDSFWGIRTADSPRKSILHQPSTCLTNSVWTICRPNVTAAAGTDTTATSPVEDTTVTIVTTAATIVRSPSQSRRETLCCCAILPCLSLYKIYMYISLCSVRNVRRTYRVIIMNHILEVLKTYYITVGNMLYWHWILKIKFHSLFSSAIAAIQDSIDFSVCVSLKMMKWEISLCFAVVVVVQVGKCLQN